MQTPQRSPAPGRLPARSVSPSANGRGVCVDPACGLPLAQCICSICTCGKHACPSRPEHEHADARTGQSAYKSDYPAHAVLPRSPPAARAAGSLEPAVPFDSVSSYRSTFVPHAVAPRTPASPPKATAEISDGTKFTGESSYHHDYPRHLISPRQAPPAHSKVPLEHVKFDGTTSYSDTFVAHKASLRSPVAPPRATVVIAEGAVRFSGESSYQKDFKAHPVALRQPVSPPRGTADLSDGVQFLAQTSYKSAWLCVCCVCALRAARGLPPPPQPPF